MIFDWAYRVRGRRKEGAGLGRGKKKCKNIEGREKRKILRVPLREGGGRQGAGGVRPNPPSPVHPLIFEKPAVTTLKMFRPVYSNYH